MLIVRSLAFDRTQLPILQPITRSSRHDRRGRLCFIVPLPSDLLMTDSMQLQNVIGQTHQGPLRLRNDPRVAAAISALNK
jgi:hypothetical protein